MAFGVKLIPLNGLNLDVANAYLQPNQARFIKNLYYQLSDTAEAGTQENSETGKLKPIESNALYCPFELPNGTNTVIGTYPSRETNELYVFVHNSLKNHFLFRLNGSTQTADVTAPNDCYNFQLSPEYFIGEGQCYLDINTFVDPGSGSELVKKDLYWTDGFNYQGYVRFEDYLATNGFDPALFPYFNGEYDKCSMVRVGLPTPKDCITYTEVPHTIEDEGLNNELLFHGTQLRVTAIDVFGRPSEHGIISDLYIPGINDCVVGSNNLPRCLDLSIFAGNPLIDKLQVEFSSDNELQWYIDSVINLYVGSPLGQWWLRERNPDIDYDPITNRVNYQFCRNKECTPIAQDETNKLQSALSKRSQAMGKVGKRIGFANNKYGFNPFPQSLKDKIHLTVTPPKQQNDTLRDITIYVCLNNSQGVKHKDNQYYFGGASNGPFYAALYKQLFPLNQKGWIGYLNDGSYTISTQWYFDPITHSLVEDVDYLHGGGTGITGPFVLQKFSFPKKQQGSYVFRLADHEFNVSNGTDLQNTSTTVFGLCPFDPATFKPFLNRTFYPTQELVIDTCSDDYDTLTDSKILVIQDCSSFNSINQRQSTKGYITEDIDGNIPIELMAINEPNGTSESSLITDHNGAYWIIQVGGNQDFTFSLRNRCEDANFTVGSGGFNGMRVLPLNMDSRPGFENFSATPCNREEIKGRVVIEGTNIGVPNVNVTLTRTRPVTTDASGYYTIIAHDWFGHFTREDSIVLGSSCGYLGQNGSCLLPVPIAFSECTVCDAASPPESPPIGGQRILQVSDIILQYLIQRSLLSGGTYGWGFSGYDWLGRKTYEQVQGYFTIPSIVQSQTIGPSTITITIDPDAVFPPDIAYIVPSITAETTQADYLDWIVDNVVFINNAGDEVATPDAATQIKIYYGSIIEFNKQNNYNTTTSWQFITTNAGATSTGVAQIADKVQFFINGDGQYFTKTIIGLVKYALDGQYFLIDYTSDLKNLQANAYIRLIRPKVCIGNEPFYEICQTINIVDRMAEINSFIANFFDTYYLSREIPVPVLTNDDPPTYINELRIPGTRFEHHSPSNIWGYKIWNRGRLNVQNPYEAEILKPNEIQLGGTLSDNGVISYLQNFNDAQKRDFIINNSGGITYFRVKAGVVCFITGYNNFIAGYNDNLARINAQGQIEVPSGDETFGKPERKTNGDYGCTLFDKNTIREREGIINFLDSSRIAVLQHNFSDCIDVSRFNKANSTIVSWLQKKIKYVQFYNRTHNNKTYFHAVINPANFEYILTDFVIGFPDYINQERQINVGIPESIALDMFGQVWKGFYSATPEYYGYLEGEKNGQQLFLFKNARPYYQYRTNESVTYGTVFGETVERVYEFILSAEIMKKLHPLWLEVYCKQSGYFCDKIVTEAGQQSRILISHFKQGEFMYAAPFLRDINTPVDPNLPQQQPNVILEGNPLFGEWVQCRMIGYPESNTEYSQLSGVQVFLYADPNTGKR